MMSSNDNKHQLDDICTVLVHRPFRMPMAMFT